MNDAKKPEPELLRKGRTFHGEVQRFYAADYEGEQLIPEQPVNASVDWRKARSRPSEVPPAFRRDDPRAKKVRFDILVLIDSADPDMPVEECQPPVRFYSLLEIKSTRFDGRSMDNIRRLVSRHRRQVVDYIGALVDFGTPDAASYPESTVAPGIIYPAAPKDEEIRRFIDALYDEECIAVVWFDELSGVEACPPAHRYTPIASATFPQLRSSCPSSRRR